METLKAIKTRRSVREFLEKEVEDEKITEILEAGRWAPSGLNNQPWRFVVIGDNEPKSRLSEQTHYGSIIESAPVCVAVFMDQEEGYDRTKDLQAIGACIQNMLLAAHSLNLGGCWLGEILKNKDRVNDILNVPDSYELMAIVAIGYPTERERVSERKNPEELLYGEPKTK
jgi:nitroreductase